MKLKCHWHGCQEHPQDPAPIEEATCQWCGGYLAYENLVGVVGVWYRIKSAWDRLRPYVFPRKCNDCGRRFKCHDDCLPF